VTYGRDMPSRVDDPTRIINAAEAAVTLEVSKRTIIRKIHSGAIPIVGTLGTQGEFLIRASVINALKAEADAKDPAVSSDD
jgi:excisionase family DNA binding protein